MIDCDEQHTDWIRKCDPDIWLGVGRDYLRKRVSSEALQELRSYLIVRLGSLGAE